MTTTIQELTRVVARQVAPSAVMSSAAAETAAPTCLPSNDYDGRLGVRISAIFVILVGSLLGK